MNPASEARVLCIRHTIPVMVLASLGVAYAATSAEATVTATASSNDVSAADPHLPGHVLVRFSSGTSAADRAALERANEATVVGHVADLGVDVLRVPVGAEQRVIDVLQQSGKVQYAELDGLATATTTPNDTYWSQQWGLSKINASTAWDVTTGSSSVVVADLDTGIDYAHADLQGKPVAGYDFVNGDSDPTDDNGHGTATAGVIAADSNNGVGVAGACWDCRIMPVKVLDANAAGNYSELANGITWATDHGARVINMSLGGTSASSTLQNAVQYAVDHGVVLVAAAGNNSSTAPFYPAADAGVLSVAATTSSDTLYSWSDYGSWVDVAAPGCDYSTWIGGGYTSQFCGTSAAAPVVSGVVGLLVSSDPSASSASLTGAIETSAKSIGSSVAYGRVDAAGALAALSSGPAPTPSPSPTSSPSSSPSPTPSPSGTSTTSSFSGSISPKSTSSSYSVTAGTGTLTASLAFTKASSMTLQLIDQSGNVVASSSGPSGLRLTASAQTGNYQLVVSGTGHANFTLTVTYPTP